MKNKVTIECKVCESKFKVSEEELEKVKKQTHGFFPCRKCGSLATVWHFGEEQK